MKVSHTTNVTAASEQAVTAVCCVQSDILQLFVVSCHSLLSESFHLLCMLLSCYNYVSRYFAKLVCSAIVVLYCILSDDSFYTTN